MFSKTILSLIASAMLFTGSVAAAEPVRIIFETDMGNDVDDVLAPVSYTHLTLPTIA